MDSAAGGPLADLLRDLQSIFGDRLEALVAYGRPGASRTPSLALVRTLTVDDLQTCARHVSTWHRAGVSTPLLLARQEFARSLDAFPIEYGEILDTHRVLFGANPFQDLSIRAEDLRRACEVQAQSHLLHLRENYVDCGARPGAVAALVTDSAPAFGTLLRRVARLDGNAAATDAELGAYAASRAGLDPRVVGDVLALAGSGASAGVDAARLFPQYLATMDTLAGFIDSWRAN
ncbi:MAG: hypothetical protein ABI665_08335 [Vicinamibacterales bacterium]